MKHFQTSDGSFRPQARPSPGSKTTRQGTVSTMTRTPGRHAQVEGGISSSSINLPTAQTQTHVLDRGFFNSIHSLQDQTTPGTVGDLVAEVKRTFWAQKSENLDRVWLTLQTILQEIMLSRGDSTFKLQHATKQTAARNGQSLPKEPPCSVEAWKTAQGDQAAQGAQAAQDAQA